MPRTSSLVINHIPINPEWAESLVGIWLIVPSSWWPDYHDDRLNSGCISLINFGKPQAYYFKVSLLWDAQ
jgi:hypothetical protein